MIIVLDIIQSSWGFPNTNLCKWIPWLRTFSQKLSPLSCTHKSTYSAWHSETASINHWIHGWCSKCNTLPETLILRSPYLQYRETIKSYTQPTTVNIIIHQYESDCNLMAHVCAGSLLTAWSKRGEGITEWVNTKSSLQQVISAFLFLLQYKTFVSSSDMHYIHAIPCPWLWITTWFLISESTTVKDKYSV
jgi:hypothetical protein